MKRSQRTFWGWGLIPIAALTFTEPLSHNVVPLEHTHPTCYSTNIPAGTKTISIASLSAAPLLVADHNAQFWGRA